MPAPEGLVTLIATEFRRRLQGEYVPRIRQCVGWLGDDLWRRPGANCNSVGNLLLHLDGNTRQWIHATFTDTGSDRDRPAEFGAVDGRSGTALMDDLAQTVDQACAIVDGLPLDQWLRRRVIQQRFEETGLSAILHVLEHFSGHAGQIYAWTKQVTGRNLAFYDL